MRLWITKSTWLQGGERISVYNAADTEKEAMEYHADEVSIEATQVQTKAVEVDFD